jgi:uncharacterized protein (DUF1778 family)
MANSSHSTTARLEARLPAELHAQMKRAAELQGRTLTDFVISAAREAAVRAIAEADNVRLSREDQERFAAAMLSPPAPSPALRRAFERHARLVEE